MTISHKARAISRQLRSIQFTAAFILLLACCSTASSSPVLVNQERYHSFLKELRCLVCQNQDLLDSHAELAVDLKQLVIKQMSAGKTDHEIRQYLVKRYGDFILFKPMLKPMTWPLWFGPGILLIMGLLGTYVWVKRAQPS
jgi:cytochrome c-type biogenesis protein CcmH